MGYIQHALNNELYCCKESGQSFVQAGALKKHERRIHKADKLYLCKECGQSFARDNTLKQHERMHTEQKSYSCNECSQSFSQSSDLKKHGRIHTGEKPYCCNDCGQSFSQGSTLKKHGRIHTGEKPYSCNECGQSFAQAYNLKQHYTKKHKLEELPAVKQGDIQKANLSQSQPGTEPTPLVVVIKEESIDLIQHLKEEQSDVSQPVTEPTPLIALIKEESSEVGLPVTEPTPLVVVIKEESSDVSQQFKEKSSDLSQPVTEPTPLVVVIKEESSDVSQPFTEPTTLVTKEESSDVFKPDLNHDGNVKLEYDCKAEGEDTILIKEFKIDVETDMESAEDDLAGYPETLKYPLCEICGRECTSQTSLREHLNQVHGVRHECNICPKTFSRAAGLKKHRENVHLRKPAEHECELCHKKFQEKFNRDFHSKKCTGPRTAKAPRKRNFIEMTCNFCQKKFSNQDNLKKHIKIKHKIKEMKEVEPITDLTCEPESNNKVDISPTAGRKYAETVSARSTARYLPSNFDDELS